MRIIHGNYLIAGVLFESTVLGFFLSFLLIPPFYLLDVQKIIFLDEYLLSFIRCIVSKVSLLKVSA